MSTTYHTSPFGIAQHPWLNKADTKYNADGVFKVSLVIGGSEAQAFKDQLDAEAKAALERFWESDEGKKVAAKDRKSWKVYAPYVADTDDEGNETGYFVFRFKQNQKLKLKDGTTKVLKIGIKDASGKKEVAKPIFGGTELRVMYTLRDIVMKSDKQVGVQLAFGQVQVRKLADTQAGGSFEEVEGYHEADEDGSSASSPATDSGGDY